MQPPQPTCAAVAGDSATPNRTLAAVAVVFAALGFLLGLVFLTAQLATLVIPDFGASSYLWLLAVIGGALGLWPALIGLVLGLIALFGARREGGSTRLSRWAVLLAVAGPVASGAGMLALYVRGWTA